MRIAEALSKMRLQPFATEADVEEALRLFQVSTLDAALSGTLSGKHARARGLGGLRGPAASRRPGAFVASVRLCGVSELPLGGQPPSPFSLPSHLPRR